jgi:hypothetical protein
MRPVHCLRITAGCRPGRESNEAGGSQHQLIEDRRILVNFEAPSFWAKQQPRHAACSMRCVRSDGFKKAENAFEHVDLIAYPVKGALATRLSDAVSKNFTFWKSVDAPASSNPPWSDDFGQLPNKWHGHCLSDGCRRRTRLRGFIQPFDGLQAM